MTSKLVVNTIEADTGISSVSFASSISMNSTAKFHFSAAGVDIGADTNINRPSAGVLGFNINDSQKVVITSNGRLGIGTDNPASNLQVDGTSLTLINKVDAANTLITVENTATGNAGLKLKNSNVEYTILATDGLRIMDEDSGGLERLRIASDGKIGINSTSPSTPLEIHTAASAAWKFRINTSVSDGAGFYQRANGEFEMVLRDASNNVNYIAGTSGALQFATSGSERLRITSDGKIGINQTSPGTGLHINQDWVASYGSISAEGGNNALVGLGLRSSGTYRAALIWRDGSSGDYLELATQSTSNPILFKTNNTERARVQDGGLKLNGGSYIMDISAGHGAPNNNNKQMDQRRWMWYGTSSSTHTVARVAKAAGGQPGDGDSQLAAFIVTYTARSMYGFNSDGGYSVMKMRTGRFDYNDNEVRFSTEQDTLGTGGGSQNPTIVFTDEGSGVVRISITNPSSTHSFGEINVMTYDCRITLPTG